VERSYENNNKGDIGMDREPSTMLMEVSTRGTRIKRIQNRSYSSRAPRI
jgi:hypothetical protein